LFEFFVQEQIVIDANIDELDLIKEVHRTGRCSTEELYVTYSLTNACNFRCTYCYQEHKKDVLDRESIRKTFRYIESHLPLYKSLRVHWFGGEPLLRLKSLLEASEELTDICARLGKAYSAGITSNGSLFSVTAARALRKAGVEQIQLTLDGALPVHNTTRITKNGSGSYDAVMRAIEVAVDEGFSTFLRINLSKKAASTLRDLLADIKARGWGPDDLNIYITEMKQHTNSLGDNSLYFPSVPKYAESFIEALRVLKEFGYPVPKLAPVDVNCTFDKPSSVLFGVDGNLYHCTTGTDRAMGELDESDSLSRENDRRRAIHSREPWDDPDCASCRNLPTCMGGCAYLDEEGHTKCNPEGFVVEQLLRLSLST